MRESGPFIHLFKTSLGYYVYDVNTGQVLKIDKGVYDYLKNAGREADELSLEKVNLLKKEGFLKSNRVKITEHPYTLLLPDALQTRVSNLILQVTQNCNLRCEYCIYSGNYDTRKHSNNRMSFEIAKKSIDFLIEHSKKRNKIYIGFYGGEPLLEFSLIKKCIEYIEKVAVGKEIGYVMTTNATLFTDEIIDYIVKHKFKLTISVDGPREIHNRSRIFANREEGSYDIMIKNIEKIHLKYPKYYQEGVKFNTVVLTDDGFSCLENYFRGDELFADAYFSSSTVSTAYSKKDKKVNYEIGDKFIQEQQYELFKLFLGKLEKLDLKYTSVLLNGYFSYLKRLETSRGQNGRMALPEKWHRGGPCIPGVTRMFVTTEGKILPCERVCEIADISHIGDVEKGIDINKAQNILNIEKFTEDKCHECWAYSECTTCLQCCDSNADTIRPNILKRCKQVKNTLEDALKDNAVLSELGYDFESDSMIGNPERILDEELYDV